MSDRLDSRIIMDKFVKQVNISMQQAYGNITISVPEISESMSTEQICNNGRLIEELIVSIVSTSLYACIFHTFFFISAEINSFVFLNFSN